jgi:hypothetical protein
MEDSSDKLTTKKWVIPFSAIVTIIHLGAVASWYVIYKLHPESTYEEKAAIFSEFWILPDIIGGRWFNGLLLVLSVIVITLAGRIVDESKNQLGIILLVINLCLVLMSGWTLL